MKKLAVLFLFVGVCLAGGIKGGLRGSKSRLKVQADFTLEWQHVARIIQMPSVYHKCNAFFVTEEFLIAPASCLLCDQLCEFQIAFGGPSVLDSVQYVNISNFVVHPLYYNSTSHGPSNNIAVIKLIEPVAEAQPLVLSKTVRRGKGLINTWAFSADMRDFIITSHVVEEVSTFMCEKVYFDVNLDELCYAAETAFELGKFNEGAVLVIDSTKDDIIDTEPVALAFHAAAKPSEYPPKYFPLISLPYYFDWINYTITQLNH